MAISDRRKFNLEELSKIDYEIRKEVRNEFAFVSSAILYHLSVDKLYLKVLVVRDSKLLQNYHYPSDAIIITPEGYWLKENMFKLVDVDQIMRAAESVVMLRKAINLPTLAIEFGKHSWDSMSKNHIFGRFRKKEDYFTFLRPELKENKRMVMPYFPKRSEIELIKYCISRGYRFSWPIIGYWENLDSACDLEEKYCSAYQEIMCKMSVTVLEKEQAPVTAVRFSSLQRATSEISEFSKSLMGTAAIPRFADYLRIRHDLFGSVVLSLWRGTEDVTKTDISVKSRFGYTGVDCNLTPDYIVEQGDDIYLVEFAVTSADLGQVARIKVKKYSALREGLEAHLKVLSRRNWRVKQKRVSILPVIFGLNTTGSMGIYLPQELEFLREQLMENVSLRDLASLDRQVRQSEVFRKLENDTLVSKEEMDEVMSDLKMTLMQSLDRYMKHKKQRDMREARMMKPTSDHEPKMIFPEDNYMLKYFRELSEKDMGALNAEIRDSLNYYMSREKFPKGVLQMVETDMEEVHGYMVNKFKREADSGLLIRNRKSLMIPKMFKFPMIDIEDLTGANSDKSFPLDWAYDLKMEDGTYLLKPTFGMENIGEERNINELGTDGIGIDVKEDMRAMKELCYYMSKPALNIVENHLMSYINEFRANDACFDRPVIKKFLRTKCWQMVNFISSLANNLALMEGRRWIKSQTDKKMNSRSVGKCFGDYWLIVRAGSRMTTQKQMRYKVIADKSKVDNFPAFHQMRSLGEYHDYSETKWLTLSSADLQHYLHIREFILTQLSYYLDLISEQTGAECSEDAFPWEWFYPQVAIWLEHKRGTSTSLQLNRYLVHSMTSVFSNRKECFDDIMKDPVRSLGEAFVRIRQMEWSMELLSQCSDLWDVRQQSVHFDSGMYDRMNFMSFYKKDMKVEFKVTLEEMYSGYAFVKSAGFSHHRQEAAVKKMMKKEDEFREKKADFERCFGFMKTERTFVKSEDDSHTFNLDFIHSALYDYMQEKSSKVAIANALSQACHDTLMDAMQMTSSLISCNHISDFIQHSDKTNTTKSFCALFELFDKMDNHTLTAVIKELPDCEAIFSLFDKAQIGGPREILIQAVNLRVYMMFLEHFFDYLGKDMKENMMAKDDLKVEVQSKTLSRFREETKENSRKGKMCNFFSFNMDCSAWANNFVMEQFWYVLKMLDLPHNISSMMESAICSFCWKVVMTPEGLKRTWDPELRAKRTKAELFEPRDKVVKAYKDEAQANGWKVIVQSGMGQGMMHRLSNFYHIVIQRKFEKLAERYFKQKYELENWEMVTMITSDDKTMIFNLTMPRKNSEFCFNMMKELVVMQDACMRMANIHLNFKKSALQILISEFNSNFSVGKRMVVPCIKDIYTMHQVVDYTSPKQAVLDYLSALSRLIKNGVYLTTIEMAAVLTRNLMMEAYSVDNELIFELLQKLGLDDEADLPYQLGFFPVKNPVECSIYGPDFQMFMHDKDDQIWKFYRGLFTANAERQTGDDIMNIRYTASGELRLMLPSRLDKAVRALKESFLRGKLNENADSIASWVNRTALDVFSEKESLATFKSFYTRYFTGMKDNYGFGESMPIHSLVRAKALPKGRAFIYPLDNKRSQDMNKFYEMSFKMKELAERSREMDMSKREAMLSEMNDLREQKIKAWERLEDSSMDILEFTDYCLNRDSLDSYIGLLDGYQKVAEVVRSVESRIEYDEAARVRHFPHEMIRHIRFYIPGVGVSLQKKEVVQFLFSDFESASARVMNGFSDICSAMGLNFSFEEMRANPFEYLKKMFPGVKHPFQYLTSLIDNYSRIGRYHTLNMVIEMMDKGSAEENLLAFYQQKMFPGYFVKEAMPDTKEEMLSTNFRAMASGLDMGADSWRQKNEQGELEPEKPISIVDNLVSVCRKLHSRSQEGWVYGDTTSCSRMFYKQFWNSKKEKVKIWTDMESLAMLKEDETTLYCHMYCKNPQVPSKTAIECYRGLMREQHLLEQSTEKRVVFMTQNENFYSSLKPNCDLGEVMFKTKLTRGLFSWSLELDMKIVIGDVDVMDVSSGYFNFYKDAMNLKKSIIMDYSLGGVKISDIASDRFGLYKTLKLMEEHHPWMSRDIRPIGVKKKAQEERSTLKYNTAEDRNDMNECINFLKGISLGDFFSKAKVSMRNFENTAAEDQVERDDNADEMPAARFFKTVRGLSLNPTKILNIASCNFDDNQEVLEQLESNEMGSLYREVSRIILRKFHTEVDINETVKNAMVSEVSREDIRTSIYYHLRWMFKEAGHPDLEPGVLLYLTYIVSDEMSTLYTIKPIGPPKKIRSQESAQCPQRNLLIFTLKTDMDTAKGMFKNMFTVAEEEEEEDDVEEDSVPTPAKRRSMMTD